MRGGRVGSLAASPTLVGAVTVRGVVVAVVLAVANLLSEWVSFSAVIDRTPPLRWVDRLGSRRA